MGVEQRRDTPLEIVTGLVILVAVGAQTWMVLQDATQGEAGRWVRRWWARTLRPAIVKLVVWVDTRAVVEAMIRDEIDPLLKGES